MKRLLIVGGVLFGIACFAIVGEMIRREYLEPKGSPSHLRRVAAQLNARAPINTPDPMLDITGAEANDKTLTVHFKVLNALAANIDAPVQRKLHEVLRSHACEKDGLREVLDGGATLRYVLVDMNSVQILDTEIQRWECGGVATSRSSPTSPSTQ